MNAFIIFILVASMSVAERGSWGNHSQQNHETRSSHGMGRGPHAESRSPTAHYPDAYYERYYDDPSTEEPEGPGGPSTRCDPCEVPDDVDE